MNAENVENMGFDKNKVGSFLDFVREAGRNITS